MRFSTPQRATTRRSVSTNHRARHGIHTKNRSSPTTTNVTLPVVLAFERATQRVRTTLEELYAAPAPLPQETVDRVRDILDDLRVRELIDREIGIHRERALHELRAVRDHASAAEPLRALERLIDTTTGAPSEAPATA